MMKKNAFYAIAAIFMLTWVVSCVQEGYDIDSINKEGAFSHENGMYIQIGSFDTIHFYDADISFPVEVTVIKTIKGLFSETIYDYLVYSSNGKEEALGSIALEGDFIAHISNAAAKGFSDFELSTNILDENEEDTGIRIEKTVYKADDPGKQLFSIVINKDDVLKLKNASALQIVFRFETEGTDKDDYVLIQNVKLKALGGIGFNLD
jgi:hypothetical protein